VRNFRGEFMHEDPQIEIREPSQPDRGRFNFALILAVVAVLVTVGALFFLPGRQSPPGAAPPGTHFAFGAAEHAYASRMRIENIALSRAENFLHQEITTLSGELVNGGDRALRGVEVTIEFSDDLNQIALREARPVLTPVAAPLAAGERRGFEVSFEHIPASWNTQQPAVRISGLQFQALTRY
jgi:hypothetical protein